MPQIGAVLVPINYRLTADDFAYIINHSGARSSAPTPTTWRPSTASATSCPNVEHFVALEGRAGRLARLRGAARRRAAPTFDAARDRRERPADDQLHQRHDRAPQGRDDHPPQRLHERRRHARPRPHDARPTATSGRCRCSTPTAGRFVWIVTAVGGDARLPAPGRAATRLRADRAASGSRMLCAAPTVLIGIANAPGGAARRRAARRARVHRRRAAGRRDDRARSKASSAGSSPRSTA